MCARIIIFAFVQLAVLNVAFSQYFNRVLPNRQVLPITETLLSNQINNLPYDRCDPYDIIPNVLSPNVIQQLPNVIQRSNLIQSLPNVISRQPNIIQSLPNVVSSQPNIIQSLPSGISSLPNVVQDVSVANNLANALQLLVVSNLLSNTLPTQEPVVYPEFINPVNNRVNYSY